MLMVVGRWGRVSRLVRSAALGTCALIVAACSGLGAPESSGVHSVALADSTTTSNAPTAEAAEELDPEILALVLDGVEAMGDGGPTTTVSDASGTTSGGRISPRVPSSPRPASPAPDASAAYRGVLGFLGPDDPVASPVATAPTAPPNAAPLTGLWVETVAQREAVVVKVDNADTARPQTGLNRADIVIEEEVEGGITRFAAIFHSQSTTVGPVRSGRSTDISFLTALGSPSLVYSGANDIFDAFLLRQPTVVNYSAARNGGYWRDRSRKAPSNLYTDTATFFRAGTPPPAQFAYRAFGVDAPWAPASMIRVDFGRTLAGWTWNPAVPGWMRSQDGAAHKTDDGQVSATNVVLAVVAEVETGVVDSSRNPVPEFVFVGTGPVTVFAGNRVIEGTWTRPTLRSAATLTDTTGQVIELNPGRTWIELVTPGAATWS